MRFNAVPWKPLGQFTGVSEYTLDSKARVVKQVDFWDSINLMEGELPSLLRARTSRYISSSPSKDRRDLNQWQAWLIRWV